MRPISGLVSAAVTHLIPPDAGPADLDADARVEDEEKEERNDVHDHQVHPVDVHLHVDLENGMFFLSSEFFTQMKDAVPV